MPVPIGETRRPKAKRVRPLGPLLTVLFAVSIQLFSPRPAPGSEAVGFVTITVGVGPRHAVPCAVWYPSEVGTARVVYDLGRAARTGDAFSDAKPDAAAGPRPLIVYSHGYSGCSIASAYLSEALAAAGFVVAAPDHTDDLKVCGLASDFRKKPLADLRVLVHALEIGDAFASGDYDIERYRYRFEEIAATIDALKKLNMDPRSPLYRLVDAGHIGAVGHSLGGFTVIAAAGAAGAAADVPLDAVVSLSGPGGEVFSCEDLGRVTIPVMLMYGEKEKDKWKKGEGLLMQYRCLAGPKYLMGLVGGTHLTFSEGLFFDRFLTDRGKEEARKRRDLICRFVTAFFTRYLMGRLEAEAILRHKDDGLDPFYFSDRP